MSSIPIYLDFDGVMNSFTRDAQRLTARTGFGRWRFLDSEHQVDGQPFPLAVSEDRNDEVRSWAAVGAQITWVTTWWEAPADVVAQTGLDVAFAAPHPPIPGSRDWKASLIETRHNESDRFIWIDDNDVPTGFGRLYPNSLIIRPSDRFGLFARDANRVRDFLT